MWVIDKVFDCGCTIKKSDFNNDVEIEFCEKHSNEYVERIEAENAALRARVEELEALSREALAALVWCSGADDFAPEGKARLGWDRVVTPVFVNGRNILTNWGKP